MAEILEIKLAAMSDIMELEAPCKSTADVRCLHFRIYQARSRWIGALVVWYQCHDVVELLTAIKSLKQTQLSINGRVSSDADISCALSLAVRCIEANTQIAYLKLAFAIHQHHHAYVLERSSCQTDLHAAVTRTSHATNSVDANLCRDLILTTCSPS